MKEEFEKLKNLFQPEELDPELAEFIEKGGLSGKMIRHPLVYEIFYQPEMNRMCNQRLRIKKESCERALSENKYSTYVWMHERPHRLWAFNEIKGRIKDDAEYWSLLGSIWVDSENIWQNRLYWTTMLFFSDRKNGMEHFMSEEERVAFKNLPDEIEIYRGCSKKNENGFSWTLDKKLADWFSKRLNKNGYVITKKVKKSDCFAHLTGRGESEIIYWKE